LSGSQIGSLTGPLGTWTGPNTFGGATVAGLYWGASLTTSTSGNYSIELTGNRASGFITSVSIDGIVRTCSNPIYSSYYDTTIFSIGTTNAYSDGLNTTSHTIILA
jgi:hypothetical protein